MALTYTITRDQHLALIEGAGCLDIAEWRATVGALLNDPRFRPDTRILLDRRGVTGVESLDFLDHAIRFLQWHSDKLHHAAWAVVVGEKAPSYGMARMLAVRASRIGMEMRVFTDAEKARAWLGQFGPAVERYRPNALLSA